MYWYYNIMFPIWLIVVIILVIVLVIVLVVILTKKKKSPYPITTKNPITTKPPTSIAGYTIFPAYSMFFVPPNAYNLTWVNNQLVTTLNQTAQNVPKMDLARGNANKKFYLVSNNTIQFPVQPTNDNPIVFTTTDNGWWFNLVSKGDGISFQMSITNGTLSYSTDSSTTSGGYMVIRDYIVNNLYLAGRNANPDTKIPADWYTPAEIGA